MILLLELCNLKQNMSNQTNWNLKLKLKTDNDLSPFPMRTSGIMALSDLAQGLVALRLRSFPDLDLLCLTKGQLLLGLARFLALVCYFC